MSAQTQHQYHRGYNLSRQTGRDQRDKQQTQTTEYKYTEADGSSLIWGAPISDNKVATVRVGMIRPHSWTNKLSTNEQCYYYPSGRWDFCTSCSSKLWLLRNSWNWTRRRARLWLRCRTTIRPKPHAVALQYINWRDKAQKHAVDAPHTSCWLKAYWQTRFCDDAGRAGKNCAKLFQKMPRFGKLHWRAAHKVLFKCYGICENWLLSTILLRAA